VRVRVTFSRTPTPARRHASRRQRDIRLPECLRQLRCVLVNDGVGCSPAKQCRPQRAFSCAQSFCGWQRSLGALPQALPFRAGDRSPIGEDVNSQAGALESGSCVRARSECLCARHHLRPAALGAPMFRGPFASGGTSSRLPLMIWQCRRGACPVLPYRPPWSALLRFPTLYVFALSLSLPHPLLRYGNSLSYHSTRPIKRCTPLH